MPSLREYAARYQIDGRRLRAAPAADAPGPGQPRRRARRPRSIDSPQALITEQVEAGVVVRMAVLYELLAGGGAPEPEPAERPTPDARRRQPA